MSVSSHLLAFGLTSTPLFRAGILQSGSPTTENYKSVNDSKADYDSILKVAGCSNSKGSTLACLRGLSADAFNSSVVGTSWMPVIDGDFVPNYPSKQLEAGKFVQLPLLLGGKTRHTLLPFRRKRTDLLSSSSSKPIRMKARLSALAASTAPSSLRALSSAATPTCPTRASTRSSSCTPTNLLSDRLTTLAMVTSRLDCRIR